MRIFVYEFISGGGGWSQDGGAVPAGSLLVEGEAMLRALVADLAATRGTKVCTTRDVRLGAAMGGDIEVQAVDSPAAEREAISRLAACADGTILIAPETDGLLLDRARWVVEAGGRLLSPGCAAITLSSDKQKTGEWLAERGVRVPQGSLWQLGELPPIARLPVVIKPVDGCGSQGVRLISTPADLTTMKANKPLRMEQFVPGQSASVAILCGAGRPVALPACAQQLSSEGRFSYLGGRTPLAPALNERARTLALRVVNCLPQTTGYIGVDLVLGQSPDGDDDFVIEINPRLTTSYVGLRAACRENLAGAMLAVALGERPALSWRDEIVQFTADGRVQITPFREADAP
ncbi:MAG: ATP-grasp domain-containing protein [Pirellulaceae bacterium]|nr:ATP-grasp domain-containing protein [Pirellulaceae bacterium]